jgi:hypothetical protein
LRVLVVADQAELADDIADGLRDRGIGADVAYDSPTGIEKAALYLMHQLPRPRGRLNPAVLLAAALVPVKPERHVHPDPRMHIEVRVVDVDVPAEGRLHIGERGRMVRQAGDPRAVRDRAE